MTTYQVVLLCQVDWACDVDVDMLINIQHKHQHKHHVAVLATAINSHCQDITCMFKYILEA